jgi:Icc-related predicted phosphoesterase
VCSGDFFPNDTRGCADIEAPYQTAWFWENHKQIVNALDRRPFVSVPGNHDFVDLVDLLQMAGYRNAHSVTLSGTLVAGKRWAGFGHIPMIAGEWNREASNKELAGMAFRTLEAQPDIVVVHAPPDGILDHPGYGNGPLVSALAYSPHSITHLFCGHSHKGKGMTEEMGIVFSNAATTLNIVDVP